MRYKKKNGGFMMFGLNREQISIIKSTGDIFVKAGAGTGKTRTITELYFDLLFNRQYEIRNILAITFTEKAANEMKERIKQKIRVFSESIEGNQKKSLAAHLCCQAFITCNFSQITSMASP